VNNATNISIISHSMMFKLTVFTGRVSHTQTVGTGSTSLSDLHGKFIVSVRFEAVDVKVKISGVDVLVLLILGNLGRVAHRVYAIVTGLATVSVVRPRKVHCC
jgi:hypothetical protein